MRQTLFRIWLERPWALWTEIADEPPRLGVCWVWLIGGALYLLAHLVAGKREILRDPLAWGGWAVMLLVLSLQSHWGILPAWLPVFGYGMMVLTGFLVAMGFTHWRAGAAGIDVQQVYDSAMWLLIPGVIGGRLAHLIQYREIVFRNARTLPETLLAAVNLSSGGLVLIGALIGGGLGFLAYCYRRKINAYEYADLLIPAVFIGIGFGRIGCLLNGCCFGERCDLPWAITFPQGSVPFQILAERGFLDPQAVATFPLHPTQIYSALDGFLLALVTGLYYWHRRYPGEVFGIGCILYSITRFLMEFLRGDELGQLGTSLTISQFYSMGLCALGIVVLVTGARRFQGSSNPQWPSRAQTAKAQACATD